MAETPVATLRIEYAMINPPKPIGCGVFVGGDLVAVVTLDELRRAIASLEADESK